MAITLAEAKVGMRDHIDIQLIDKFQRSSALMDMLTFDDAVAAGGSGSTFVYGYLQLSSPATAAVRAINSEYTSGEAKRVEKTAKCVVMGGSYMIDRAIANSSGAIDEVELQTNEKVTATKNYFHNLVINGTSATSGTGYVPNTFDGLKASLSGTDHEFTSAVDLSTSALTTTNAQELLDELDALISSIDGDPDVMLMNTAMLNKVRSCARRAGYYTREENSLGMVTEYYGKVLMMDAGKYYDGSSSVDVIETSTPSTTAYGTTDIYVTCLGLDAFHGISLDGQKIATTHLPDFTTAGAVKEGDVEMIAGAVLKNTNKAAVLQGIAIKPKSSAS